MKKSIRVKLFIAVSSLIVFFVLTSWVLNTQYLDKYYIAQKKKTLVQSYYTIDRVYKENPDEISLELEQLESTAGVSIAILSQDFRIKYDSRLFRAPSERDPRRRSLDFQSRNLRRGGLSYGKYVIETAKDLRLNTNFINLTSLLSTGDIIMLSVPISAMKESADIANRFFVITGLITIVIGSIIVFLFSNKFTRPILELSDIARRMSSLDFSKKYNVKSDDEIGELGESINSLSDQLDMSISELREVNKKLMKDIERERRIDEMRKEFISNVSHELKTPITLIQGYAEGLKSNIAEDEESREFYCDVIMDESGKMGKLVRDLLDLSQIDSGSFKLDRSIFDVSYLIDHVLDKFQPVFKEKGIALNVDKDPDIEVDGDIVRVEQVLTNYINNAVNHVDENKLIKINVTKNESKVRVSVFNPGKHIPEESLNKIWVSFYKVDKARTRAYGGTGLGLSIVRAIQELHGNDFGVANIEGGVEFWFEIDSKEENK